MIDQQHLVGAVAEGLTDYVAHLVADDQRLELASQGCRQLASLGQKLEADRRGLAAALLYEHPEVLVSLFHGLPGLSEHVISDEAVDQSSDAGLGWFDDLVLSTGQHHRIHALDLGRRTSQAAPRRVYVQVVHRERRNV